MSGLRRLRPPAGSAEVSFATLPPLVDVLTLLLLFLLQAWSSDTPVRVDELGFTLPRSAEQAAAAKRVAIDVGRTGIWYDGVRVGGTEYYLVTDEVLVREVYEVALRRSGEPVVLRVDGRVPYRIVRKLLFTLEEAGVDEVAMTAESRGGL